MVLGWIIEAKVTYRYSKEERGKLEIKENRIVVKTDGASQSTILEVAYIKA